MGPVETEMLAYVQRCLAAGRLSVPAKEIVDAVVPPEHPEWRHQAAYRYGLKRLHCRHVLNAITASDGVTHYFIGRAPSAELRSSLGLE